MLDTYAGAHFSAQALDKYAGTYKDPGTPAAWAGSIVVPGPWRAALVQFLAQGEGMQAVAGQAPCRLSCRLAHECGNMQAVPWQNALVCLDRPASLATSAVLFDKYAGLDEPQAPSAAATPGHAWGSPPTVVKDAAVVTRHLGSGACSAQPRGSRLPRPVDHRSAAGPAQRVFGEALGRANLHVYTK